MNTDSGMSKEMKNLSELLALEKSGHYQEALDRIQSMAGGTPGESPVRSLNLKLLEQRLRARIQSTQPQAKSAATSNKSTQKSEINNKPPTWTAIITMWKRQDYLSEQLAAIRSQSIPPQEIIIILNEGHIPESKIRELGGPEIKLIRSDINSLYSRWALAYIAEGEYVSVFDDDVIPGKYWIANAIRACSSYNALVGAAGRIYNKNGMHGYYKLVVPNADNLNTISCGETDVYCDWVCNSYLFKREWVHHALSSPRYKDSFKTFDDIQLATSLYLNGGIRCVTPMQPSFDKELHGSLKHHYGNDAHAIWKTNSDHHFAERKAYIERLIDQGYVPVQLRDNLYRFHLIVPFGERATLERCLLSVKGQDYQNFTCTLIDDCGDGSDAMELVRRLGLDELNFRYIKTTKKAYPLRAREIATDMLAANPADVIVHLDGDDWLPYPDVLSRLNRIYRNGGVLASYGNAISIRDKDIKTTSQIERDSYGNPRVKRKLNNFSEYSPYMMSKRWNVVQKSPSAEWFPMRRLTKSELSNGWKGAPWCGMHLRTFQFVKWLELDRSTFANNSGSYLRVATDAAIFVPILNSCKYESVAFVDDIGYIYQDAGNTIHSKNEISDNEKAESLAIIASSKSLTNQARIRDYLKQDTSLTNPSNDSIILYDNLGETLLSSRQVKAIYSESKIWKNAVTTVITPNFMADGIICLQSYCINVRNKCDMYLYISTDNEVDVFNCRALLEGTGINAVFPSSLEHTRDYSNSLSEKYKFDSDEYRWSMKAVMLIELLLRGYDSAVFLDPDTYTVSDITDIQSRINQHPVTVFPHFRDPDNDYLRGVLYKDGFFNGGMLGATRSGIKHLERLYARCLNELVKDPARNKWDDQKYYDIFILEVDGLFVNLDRGIDYNPWNYEPVEGLISPSQRSIMLGSGYFVRHWHVSTMLIKNAIELKQDKYSVFRPVVSIYLMSLLYVIIFLLVKSKSSSPRFDENFLGLKSRFENIAEKLSQISSAIPISEINALLSQLSQTNWIGCDQLMQGCVDSIVKSICFDNYELFARILGGLFPDSDTASKLQRHLRRHDLRYIADEVVGSPDLKIEEKESLYEIVDAGNLVKRRLQALQSCKISY